MAEGEMRQVEAEASEHSEPVPLTRRQQQAAAGIGGVLAVSGIAAVFTGGNQAGSVALLVGGALFLLVAVSGMPIVGAKLRDFELHLAVRRNEAVRRTASRLPDAEADRFLEIIESAYGSSEEPLLELIEMLLLDIRVRDGLVSDLEPGERVEPHPEAGIGEPLVVHVSADGEVRIGVFSMYARTCPTEYPAAFAAEFLERIRATGCDAFVFVTAVRDNGAFGSLAAQVRAQGRPVSVEDWRPLGEPRPLRPAIERLTSEVLARRADGAGVMPPRAPRP
ncbi:hypothetical protein ACQEWB_15070 [Streptomyces sp. CA-249302]|uniref:hypothetical protein n=1 Tax=Streptomyces sp. CA-249302 TaxID=3240058 RepID=UPI003D8AB327